METALMEITLVVLTTLAPAGIVAYAALAVWLVASRSPEECNAVSHWLIVPLVFPLLGFVASATHLGTPANALYVLTGIGRSPCSTRPRMRWRRTTERPSLLAAEKGLWR